MRFDQHLHNGDPLSGRTTHVPPGRPRPASPPFTWEQSAHDAIIRSGSIASPTGRCRTSCSTGTATTASTTSTNAAAFPRPICGAARRTIRRASTLPTACSTPNSCPPARGGRPPEGAGRSRCRDGRSASGAGRQSGGDGGCQYTSAARCQSSGQRSPLRGAASTCARSPSMPARPPFRTLPTSLPIRGCSGRAGATAARVRRQARTGVAAHSRLRGDHRCGFRARRPPISSRHSRPGRGGQRRASSTNRPGTC